MYRAAVMGDYDSIYGFAALGLDTVAVEPRDPRACARALEHLVAADYAIVYLTEGVAAVVEDVVLALSERPTPAVILIPGVTGNTGEGARQLARSVERAVGSDIL